MAGPKVSVIIPVFNTEPYLGRCIESVISQTLRDIEIILVDDGTPDACGAICDEYALKDRRILVIHQENMGAGAARNSGIRIAAGEYVGFVDSDDYIDPQLFERLYHAADEAGADVCYGGIVRPDGKADSSAVSHPLLYAGDIVRHEFLPNLIVPPPGKGNRYYSRGSACSAAYKRSVIQDNRVSFSEEKQLLGEDCLFNMDFCRHAALIRIIPQPGYYVCWNPASTTRKYRSDYLEARKLFCRLYRDRAKAMDLHARDPWRTDYLLLMTAAICILHEMSFHKVLGQKALLAYIQKIIADPEISAVLERYPLRELPLKHMIFFTFMRLGFLRALYILGRVHMAYKKLIRPKRINL